MSLVCLTSFFKAQHGLTIFVQKEQQQKSYEKTDNLHNERRTKIGYNAGLLCDLDNTYRKVAKKASRVYS